MGSWMLTNPIENVENVRESDDAYAMGKESAFSETERVFSEGYFEKGNRSAQL